jgi:Na+/proline symporter
MVTGIGNLCYVVDSLFALVLVGVFFAIPYRRLKLSSTGQILDRRFGSKRRQWLASLCVQTEYLIININIIEPFVFGTIVSSVTGLPFVYGVYFGGIVILTFAATVGLRAPVLQI